LKIEYAVQLTIIDERLVCVRFGSVYIGVAAQAPEIFSRFLFDSASLGSLVGSVGPLTAPVFGLSLANGTATTILVTGRSTISLDWSGQGFNSGFYVSFWFRFVDRNASLNETKLFTSQSVNISVALDSTTDTATLNAGFMLNDSASMANTRAFSFGVGTTWRRVSVGFVGSSAYLRMYRFDVVNNASDQERQPWVLSTAMIVRSSTSMVLGGTFSPQRLEFKDLVLIRPLSEMISPAFDEILALEHNPNLDPSPSHFSITPSTDLASTSATGASLSSFQPPHNTTVSMNTSAATTMSLMSAASAPAAVVSGDASTTLTASIVGSLLTLIALLALAFLWRRRRSAAANVELKPPQRDAEYGNVDAFGLEYGMAPPALVEYADVADVRAGIGEYDMPQSKLVA
jgi:hypothetical protein